MPSSVMLALVLSLGCILCASLVLLAVVLRRLRRAQATQAEAVRQAAAEAREQFGRDVHDLVSSRLWLASLTAELAYRLADQNAPVRPALADVIESIQQAATDIRNLTRSYQEISLWSEIANARAVLGAYGIDCKVELADVELAPQVGAVLAVTVREAVTNVLRHSSARLCVIEMSVEGGSVILSVANDGVEPIVARQGAGSGIDNLRSRAAALDGVVGTILDLDGWFRLVVEIPNRARR